MYETLESFSSQIHSTSEVSSPGTVTSRGRNLIGNIRQKFWTDKLRKSDSPILSTPEPVQRILTAGSRSTSASSLKIESQNNTQDTFECSESEEYFVPLNNAATGIFYMKPFIGASKRPKLLNNNGTDEQCCKSSGLEKILDQNRLA